MKKVRDQGRQGDVLLTRVNALPGLCAETPPKDGRIILAYGEATGHSHEMPTGHTRLFDYYGRTYVEITGKDPQPLIHQEHETLLLDPGIYFVRIQVQHFDGIPGWSGVYGLD